VISTDGYLPPWTVERLRALTPSATWVLWYPDHLGNLADQSALVAPYDFLFFKDPYLVDLLLTRTSLRVHYLPEACNIRRHRPEPFLSSAEMGRYCADVAIAGNIYPYRVAILETLPTNVELKLYGNMSRFVRSQRVRDAFTGEYVVGRNKVLAFRGAKIVLNTLHYGEIGSVNARLFEATACGGFVLTHRAPTLGEFFEDGKEVASFESASELRASVRHYLEADEDRMAIAEAGRARAHRDHTYEVRLDEMARVGGFGI